MNIVGASHKGVTGKIQLTPLFFSDKMNRGIKNMSIKLLLLKSGEDIIADISEMISSEAENVRVIGYFLDKPCVVKMRNPGPLNESSEKGEQTKAAYQVSLFPWMPLSKEEKIPIPSDWVITMTTPVNRLEEMYVEEVIERAKNNQNTSTTEQSDSNNTD